MAQLHKMTPTHLHSTQKTSTSSSKLKIFNCMFRRKREDFQREVLKGQETKTLKQWVWTQCLWPGQGMQHEAGGVDRPGWECKQPLCHANTFNDLFRTSLGLQVFCNKAEADRIGKISIKLRYLQVLWIHFENLYHRSHWNENVTLLS